MKAFLAPLRALDRHATVAVLGGLGLLVAWLYAIPGAPFLHAPPGEAAFDLAAAMDARLFEFLLALGLLVVVPALWTLLGEKRSLRALGVTLGDWRFGAAAVAIAAVALTGPLYLAAGDPAMRVEYPLVPIRELDLAAFLRWEATYFIYYVAFEFFFRGFWQIGLTPRLGAGAAMFVQIIASTLLHIGKPGAETAGAIVAGVGFGLLALRTRSLLWGLLLHAYVGAATDFFCILRR